MSKRWTEFESNAGNIVSTDGFNTEYNTQKGSLNGGVDRTMLPGDTFDRRHLKERAFHGVSLTTNLELNPDFRGTNGSTQEFNGLEYDFYSGGWRPAVSPIVVTDVHEGMAHIEWSCWYWYNRFTSGFDIDPSPTSGNVATEANHDHWVRFRVLYNGLAVLQTSKLYTQFDNLVLTADHPIVGGDARYEVQFSFSPAATHGKPVDDKNTPMMYFGGGQFLCIPRWR